MSSLLTTMLPRCCSAALVLLLLCVLTVTDAAAQTVTLSLSPASLTEDAGSADIAVTATLSATRSSATTVTLSLAGTATRGAGKDYTTPQNPLPTITIPANATTGNTTLIISPVDDTFWEGDETIEVNGSAGGLTVTGATLTLTDNDEAPSIQLVFISHSNNPSVFAEQATSVNVEFEARLEGGTTLEEDIDITLVLEGTAIRDEDYTVNPDPLPAITILAGQTTGRLSFTITAVNDMETTVDEYIRWRGSVEDETLSVTVAPYPYQIIIQSEGRLLGARTRIEGRRAWVYEDSGPFVATFEPYANKPTEALGAPATFTISVATSWETQVTMNPDPVIITIGANQVPPVASTTATLTFMPGFDISADRTLFFDSNIDFPALRQKSETGRVNVLARDDITLSQNQRIGIPFFDQARFIEGDRIFLRVRFSGAFSSTTNGILQLYLDDDLREVICGKGSGPTRSLECIYVVQAGDFADMIRFPVQENLFPDAVLTRHYSGDAVTVNSAITTEQTLSRQVRGGVNYIELLTDRESLQEGVGATEVKVQATILQGSLPTDDIEIPLVLTDDTTTPADYTVSGTQTITIPATQSSGSATLLITPVEDYVKENRTETIRVEGGMSPYWVEGADLDIIDAPSIVLSVDDMSITEGGGAQAVTVTAALGDAFDQVRPRPIPVMLRLFGSAGGGDYTVAEQLSVTIPANDRSASRTLTFMPVDDLLLEGDETIVLRGSTPGLTVEGAELVLEDNDEVPEVVLIIDDNVIVESDGAKQVMVTAELDPTVIVNNNTVITLNLMGSAIQDEYGDYTASWNPSNKITVPALSAMGTASVTLTITPVDDEVAEGDETIEVEGMAVVGNTGVERIVRVVTITLKDDDLPGVVIDPTVLAVPEGGNNTYTVKLTTEPTANVRVGMTAVLSATDISVDSEVLTFTPDNWNEAQTMTVRAVEDNDAITNDPVTLTHTASGGGYDDVVVDDVTVTITENDTPMLSIADVSLQEADANMTFTVALNVLSDKEITVDYATSDGTATAGDDYTAVSATTLTFAAETTSQTFTVPILEDDLDEGDETFTVTLSNAINATLSGGETTLEATGTIIDEDRKPIVTLTPADLSVAEDAGTMDFTVSLDAESSKEITVDYATSDVTAIAGKDYTAVSLTTLTFAAGETEKTFTVPILEDDIDEDNETFIVRLSAPVNAAFAGDVSAIEATGTITDNDDLPSLSIADVSLVEANANMTFTVTLSAASGKTVTVDYATSDVTASEPADYAETDGTLTFSPGETEKTFPVTIKEDFVDEEEEETFTVTLSNWSNATVADATATGTIEDDDIPQLVVSFDPATYTVDEGSEVTVTVRLNVDPEQTVSIRIGKTHEGGATSADYSGVPGNLIFNAGETEKTITFMAADDDIDDDDEKVVISFRQLSYIGIETLEGKDRATVSITDDDDPQVTVSFDQTTYTVNEGSEVTVTVRLSADPERTVTIPIETTDQGGATSADYSGGAPGNLIFNAGETVKTITFTATDDDIDDNNEKVVLSFGTLTDDRVRKGSSATVTIADDDERGVTVEPTTLNVPEGENRTYTVVLKSEPTADVTVTVSVPSGRMGDVSVTGSPLTFTSSNWREAQTVTVNAENDDSVLQDADVTLTHGVTGGDYADESASSVIVTIINDDSPTLTIDDVRAAENIGTMIFNVNR